MPPELGPPEFGAADLADDLALAHRLADEGGAIALDYFTRGVEVRRKDDGSPVSDADEQSEGAIRAIVRAVRPDDAFLGEERGASGSGTRRWIVDAIDGTYAFVRANPKWAVLLALEIDGEVALGLTWSPARDLRCWATRGGGAWRRTGDGPTTRLHVSSTTELADATFGMLGTHGSDLMRNAFGVTYPARGYPDHPALLVADGTHDVSMHLAGGPWDHAAMVPIVEEAGGRFTDLAGGRRLDTETAVFTNGLLHDAVLARVAATPGS